MVKQLSISTRAQGLHEITGQVLQAVREAKIGEGLCTVFVRHTSASLVIQENADPTAKQDLERWLNRLVPEGDPFYKHDAEGPDDMPAHIKAALTHTSLSIPIVAGRLALGTWQGVYLWEHRHRGVERGDGQRSSLDYKELPRDVDAGALLLLDDGKIVLEVTAVRGEEVHTVVRHGGVLSNNKGINRQGGGLTAPALTSKDMEDIKTAAGIQADYLAVSFPKTGADMYMARELMRAAGGKAFLIAKIERAEAVGENALLDIMRGSDAIMVARGDLAVEVGDAAVPALQKKMIRLGREQNKLTITATQMMESMISSPVPTRAEVSDVANAVLDGTDAVMLSAETATGKYPVETIASMSRICAVAEDSAEVTLDRDFLDRVFTRVDQSIAMAALFTAYHLKVKAIASLTESGSTALWMSRLNAGVPIYALTSQPSTRYPSALFREVFPLMVKYVGHDREELLREAEKVLVENRVVKEGDLIVLTIGEPIGKAGGTNTMKIVRVGERRTP